MKSNNYFQRIIKSLMKIVKAALLFLLLTLLLFAGYLYLRKDAIKASIITIVDHSFNGRLEINKIKFSPFVNFPNVTIRLSEASYYKTKQDLLPFIDVENAFISFELGELLVNNYVVNTIDIKNGSFFIRKEGTSLASSIDTAHIAILNDPLLAVKFQELSLNNFSIAIQNEENAIKQAQFNENDLSSFLKFELDFKIEEIKMGLRSFTVDKKIELNASVLIHEERKIIEIIRSNFSFSGFHLDVDGNYDYSSKDSLAISFNAQDKDLTIFNILMDNEILVNDLNSIKKGDITLSGSINGPLRTGDPQFKAKLVLDDFYVELPNSESMIKDFGFESYLSIGDIKELTLSKFVLKNLRGELPGGLIKGNISVENILNPKINGEFTLGVDLEKLNKLIDVDFIDSLLGYVHMEAKFNNFEPLVDKTELGDNEFYKLKLRDIQFRIPGITHRIQNINGSLIYDSGLYKIEKLSILDEWNQIEIDGEFNHLENIIFGIQKPIQANFHLNIKRFELDKLIVIDSLISERSKVLITEGKADFNILTDVRSLLNYSVFPSSKIKIESLKVQWDSVVKINDASIYMSIEDNPMNMNILIEEAEIKSDLGYLKMDADILMLENYELNVQANYSLQDIKYQRLISIISKNTQLQFSSSESLLKMLGNLEGEISFSPLQVYNFSLKIDDMNFLSDSSFLNIHNVDLFINELNLANNESANELPFIKSFEGDLVIENIESQLLKGEGFNISVNGVNDKFEISSQTKQMSGTIEQGEYIVDFSTAIPSYEFNYSIPDFNAGDFLNIVSEEESLDGNMSFEVNLKGQGNTKVELLQSLKGMISLKGDDLTLHGIDLDEIFKKFDRSQKFNLSDIGAVFLVGPFGAVLTKGADFASLSKVKVNIEDTTNITRFVSLWRLDNGKIATSDVAFSTDEHLIILDGQIDLLKDSIDNFTVGLVDKKACLLISQNVHGKYDDLIFGEINAVNTLLGAVINLVDVVGGTKCDPFYEGSVDHPKKKKSK